MINLSVSGDSILFTFTDSNYYLYGNGTISAPLNSLALVTDESNFATFKKAATNDIFVSAPYSDFGMTKQELVEYFKENMVGGNGGGGGGNTYTVELTQAEYDALVSAGTVSADTYYIITDATPIDVSNFFDGVEYDSGTTRINFYNGNTIKAYIDASAFIVDGMIDNVSIETISGTSYLVMDFNTASGKEDIQIPLTDIFDPSNYYNKSEVDAALSGKIDTSAITSSITWASTDSQVPSAKALYNERLYAGDGIEINGKSIYATYRGFPYYTEDTFHPIHNDFYIKKASDCPSATTSESYINVHKDEEFYAYHIFCDYENGYCDVTSDDPDAPFWDELFRIFWDSDKGMFHVEKGHLGDEYEMDFSDDGCSRYSELSYGDSMNTTDAIDDLDARLNDKADTSAVTESIETAVSGKVDTSAFTTYSGSVETALSGKQDTLIAGTNITISGNVISATGGGGGGATYTAGDGITIDSANTITATYRGYKMTTEEAYSFENITTDFYLKRADDCGEEGDSYIQAVLYIDGVACEYHIMHSYPSHTYSVYPTYEGEAPADGWEDFFSIEWDDSVGMFKITVLQEISYFGDYTCSRVVDPSWIVFDWSGTTTNAIDTIHEELSKISGAVTSIDSSIRSDSFSITSYNNSQFIGDAQLHLDGGLAGKYDDIYGYGNTITTKMQSTPYQWMSAATSDSYMSSEFNAPSSTITFDMSRNPTYLLSWCDGGSCIGLINSDGSNADPNSFSIVNDNGHITVTAIGDNLIRRIYDNSGELNQYISNLQYWGYEYDTIPNVVNSKQDILSAGTGISIVDNVISATGGGGGGTTYSAGTNIDITNDTISCTLPITATSGSSIITNSNTNTATTANGSFVGGQQNNLKNTNNSLVFGQSNVVSPTTTVHRTNMIGNSNTAYKSDVFIGGDNNKARNQFETDFGHYNNSVSGSSTFGDSGNTLFSVGNGTADDARHNALEVRQNGDIYISKDGSDVKLQDVIPTVTNTIASGSTDAISSGAVYNAIGDIETLLSQI